MTRIGVRQTRPRFVLAVCGGLMVAAAAPAAWAQISLRPDEPLGLSIRERRVRVIHSETPDLAGTSMHLQQADPWLAYQRGRSYFFHEWSREDGVFAAVNPRPLGATTTSCGMCHNLPFRSPGSGGNTAEPIGYGRNAPHLFGAGLMEMIGFEIRAQLLKALDGNNNGWLDVPAETAGRRAVVEVVPGTELDFGALDDGDGDGWPDLDLAIKVFLVDAEGKALRRGPDGRRARLGTPGVAGYDLAVGVFSTSAGDHQFPTLRSFLGGVLITIMGMAADDPTLLMGLDPGSEARAAEAVWAETSNAGARQVNAELQAQARSTLEALEGALDGTVGEGEVDLLEWYLLNHPPPALGPQNDATRRGRKLLGEMGCTSCHVPDWALRAADADGAFAGDRRFFHLEVRHNPENDRLEGELQRLVREVQRSDRSALWLPRREGFRVAGIFTDLRHHDLGERFHEHIYFRGRTFPVRHFRTAPLWGVGSTAPYGHDGRSPTLDDVIRRHGGEAEAAARAYSGAPREDREALISFLRSLVLYQPDLLPTDLDGDGRISDDFRVAGRPAGPERFQPELLFRVPPRYRGWSEGPDGSRFFSYALLNREAAYGEDLAALIDRDRDGLPDLAERRAAGGGAGASSPSAGELGGGRN